MKTNYKNFEITAVYAGDKCSPWDKSNYNYYKISVKNTETRKRTTFNFWCSIAHPEIENENDILEAFECFLNDATAGDYDIDDFYREFYGDGEIENALKAWRGCKKAYKNAVRVVGDIDTVYDLLNELNY